MSETFVTFNECKTGIFWHLLLISSFSGTVLDMEVEIGEEKVQRRLARAHERQVRILF